MDHNLTNKNALGHAHLEHPILVTTPHIVLPVGSDNSGWYTIAEGSGRCFSKFFIYDMTSSSHCLVEGAVAFAYGTFGLDINMALTHNQQTIRSFRIIYTTADRTYGLCKLQVYIDQMYPDYATINIYPKFMFGDIRQLPGWTDSWVFPSTPPLENLPAGFSVDTETEVSNVYDGRVISANLEIKGTSNTTEGGTHIVGSDQRIKENIEVIESPLSKIREISGITYTRNDIEDTTTRHAGIIAQDMQEVLPEAVISDSKGMLSISYGGVTPLILEGVKALSNKLDAITRKLNALP